MFMGGSPRAIADQIEQAVDLGGRQSRRAELTDEPGARPGRIGARRGDGVQDADHPS
jgi:hypothetical protein